MLVKKNQKKCGVLTDNTTIGDAIRSKTNNFWNIVSLDSSSWVSRDEKRFFV